jgi:aspartate-semialdehyde dehydrogenase
LGKNPEWSFKMEKTNVGIIGATGMVGQNYIRLLANHPWFKVTYVAASPSSAGKTYEEAVNGRWHMALDIPDEVRNLVVQDASNIQAALSHCAFVFSAASLDKAAIRAMEDAYAKAGLPVISNNSAHRGTKDVPVLIPEINAHHVDIIPSQRKVRGWNKGFIAVKPNCSVQSYMAPMHALREAGFSISHAVVTTLQAVSGAGYPGVPSLDIQDNIVPFIGGEEEKSEQEPQKIFGGIKDGAFIPDESIQISAHCNRVPVVDGHTACVSLKFSGAAPPMDEIRQIFETFRSVPQELKLPFAPERPIIVRTETNRPQPRKDRDADKAMAVTVGRIRPCNVFDLRFVGLSHNTVRGAAGGGILNAELLKAVGYL